MSKIYLVTSGEYSDYSVDFAFSTMELAENAIKELGIYEPYNDYKIEEFEIDTKIKDRRLHEYSIPFDADGNAQIEKYSLIFSYDFLEYDNDYHPQLGLARIYLKEKDDERAIKIACEIKSKYVQYHRYQFTVIQSDSQIKIYSEKHSLHLSDIPPGNNITRGGDVYIDNIPHKIYYLNIFLLNEDAETAAQIAKEMVEDVKNSANLGLML